MLWAEEPAAPRVSGSVNVGLSTEFSEECDQLDYTYSTNDPKLGTNSGQRYFSDIDDVNRNLHATYGVDLDIHLHPNHSLAVLLEGANDYEHAIGSRSEYLYSKEGDVLSRVQGTYNRPHELSNELTAGLDYTYRLRRPGAALTLGYRYSWQNEQAGVEQHVTEATGWSMYETNMLEQQINYHTHNAHLDYVLPVKKGHLLDFGLAYNRRELLVHSEQDWDGLRVLDADYRHLMQYGDAHARYRLKLGPVEAMARLEYRATRMQERWLHDVLPLATIRYRIDSLHALSAFYTIMLIRPDVQHLDTTQIVDAYTTRFGKDGIVGVHVHNVALTYLLHLPKVDASAEVRYLTATDGFNAIWMERAGRRIYTWGNEGVRHAVGLTLSADGHVSPTTDLFASANVMWDKRVAAAIHLENANWGIRAKARLTQLLYATAGEQTSSPTDKLKLNLVLRGDYAFHNTLDVYSHSGHGGTAAGELELALHGMKLAVGYTCLLTPDIHITQGAYVGTVVYRPGATHIAALRFSYDF